MTPSPGESDQAGDLQPILDEVVAAGAPGITAHIQSPTQTLSLTSGVADRDTGAPMTPDLYARIGSSTKSFVATVILQLVNEGSLSLEHLVSQWVPWPAETPPQCQAITVRQLLNHTSGLFAFTDDQGWLASALKGQIFDPHELVSIAVKHPLHFTPGTGCKYSNTDYTLAGLIIEKVTGHSLGDQLDTRIFRRLELNHTIYPTSTQMPEPHAKGYAFVPDVGYVELTHTVHPSAYWGAGAIISTATDLGKFFRELLSGTLLPPNLLNAMKETVADAQGVEFGLGISREVSQCGDMWGHGGAVFGYPTVKACSSEDGARSAVIMTNLYPPVDSVKEPLGIATAAVLCHALLDHMPAEAKTATPVNLVPTFDDWSGFAEIIKQIHRRNST